MRGAGSVLEIPCFLPSSLPLLPSTPSSLSFPFPWLARTVRTPRHATPDLRELLKVHVDGGHVGRQAQQARAQVQHQRHREVEWHQRVRSEQEVEDARDRLETHGATTRTFVVGEIELGADGQADKQAGRWVRGKKLEAQQVCRRSVSRAG